MSIKISGSQSAVAYHIVNGPFTFPYAVDAHSAVSRFPGEWSFTPWSLEAESKAREAAGEEVLELTPEEQAAIDEHARAVAEANERLKAFREKKAAEKAEADQVAADEALVKSPAPRPDPAIKRPFGRKGEPTAAELEQIRKREEKKANDERIVREKAEQDAQAAASASGAKFTS
jgi:hypothetical protein